MKTSEIRELSIKEIEERIEIEIAEINKLELNHSISPLDNPMKIRESRRNIARLQTILQEKQLIEK